MHSEITIKDRSYDQINQPINRESAPVENQKLAFRFLARRGVRHATYGACAAPHGGGQPAEPFSILLSGPYKPVAQGHGPDLGLTTVDLSDGSFSTTKIFAVSGLSEDIIGHGNGATKKPIGNFYVQFDGSSAAYDLPGGAISMVFTGRNDQNVPDGQGGTYFVGTYELDIPEATGIYQSFVGGHNTMVDILHLLADGSAVEHCICIISRPRPV